MSSLVDSTTSISQKPSLKSNLSKRASSNNDLFTDYTKISSQRSILTIRGSSDDPLNSNITNQLEKDELFDPSLVFVSSYRCFYYDTKRRIRKGKLYISLNELLFKCSGMPFVKCHLKFEKIKEIQILKYCENLKKKCICIQSHADKKYVFFKFYLPLKIVYSNLKHLHKKFEKSNPNTAISSLKSSKELNKSTSILYEPSMKATIQSTYDETIVKHRRSSSRIRDESMNKVESSSDKVDTSQKVSLYFKFFSFWK